MPKINKCRHCASCCFRCIFLTLDYKKRLFSCMIYDNKSRIPIDAVTNLGIVITKIDDEDIHRIERIASNHDFICHRWYCDTPSTNHAIKIKERIKEYERWLPFVLEKRKNILNFNILVDILNEECE